MIVPASLCVWALNALQNSMMFTPCWPSAGPTGGAGFAAPAGICSLIMVRTLRAILDFLHLVVTDLDGSFPSKDGYQDLQLRCVLVDLRDLAREVGQGAGDHLHGLADRELSTRARPLGGLAVQEAVDLRLAQRDGLVA